MIWMNHVQHCGLVVSAQRMTFYYSYHAWNFSWEWMGSRRGLSEASFVQNVLPFVRMASCPLWFLRYVLTICLMVWPIPVILFCRKEKPTVFPVINQNTMKRQLQRWMSWCLKVVPTASLNYTYDYYMKFKFHDVCKYLGFSVIYGSANENKSFLYCHANKEKY